MRKFFGQRRILKCSLILLFVILAGTYFLLGAYHNKRIEAQPDITAASRWAPDERQAQISCYLYPGAGVSEYTLLGTKFNINKQLRMLGKQKEEEQDTFLMSWYGEDTVNVSNERNNVKATAYAVGGDFFYLHPIQMLEGACFTDDEIMKDYCLLDDEVAFELFGSYDIVGRMVQIDGYEYIIHGVFEKSTARFMKEAGNTGKSIYLSSDGQALICGLDMTEERNVSAVEFVLPNDLTGYAEDIVKQCFSPYEDCLTVDQSQRYKMKSLWETYKTRATRSMALTAIRLPWWENVARAYQDILSRVFILRAICALADVLLVLALLVWMYRNLRPSGEDIKNFFGKFGEKLHGNRIAKEKTKEVREKDETI